MMNLRLVLLGIVFSLSTPLLTGAETVKNIARSASATAGSEHDENYSAQCAIDGIIPERGGNLESNVWATNGPACGFATWFRLEWPQDVTVAEIVYYARTIAPEECFKDYDVYVNVDSESMKTAQPVFSGVLKKTRSPQRMTFPNPCQVKSILIDFTSSYTSRINPGAAEIEVYPVPPSDEQLSFGVEKRTPREQNLAKDIFENKFDFKEILVAKRHHVYPSHVYTYHVEGFVPGGGLYVYTPHENDVLEQPPQLRQLVDSPHGMILDADLSWDAKQVVFSWKQGGFQNGTSMWEQIDVSCTSPEENYHIWKINIDGTGLTQLTHGGSNNLNPCWLPDGGIAFISDRKPAYAYCWCVTSPVMYRMEADGSQPKRLSSNYLMDFTPAVLNDGRIIFTRWEYVDRPAAPIQSLWTINPDGTNLAGYYGNRVLAPGTFMDTRAIPGSDKVLALATNHNGECTGGIVVLDRTLGSNAPEALLNTTPEVDIFNPGDQWGNGLYGPYEKPYPINDGIYLVSRRGTVQARTYENERVTLLPESPDGMGFYSAQPIRSRTIPPVVRGSTFDESVTLPEDGSASGSWATLFMQDVYNGLEPQVKRGTVKKIAVVQEIEKESHAPFTHIDENGHYVINGVFSFQFPLVSCGATFSPKKVWGFADVHEDGSACFKVPSEMPINFLALDEEGRAVQRMRTFTHLMPGEVQGCVGCHSDRNFAVSSNKSQFLCDVNHPQELQLPEWGVRGFSYREIVQPILDRHCVECHNAKDYPNGVDLSGDYTDFFNVSYEILARKGTYGESHYRWNGVRRDSRFEGVNPYTSWIWTTNGAEWNILEIDPYRWGSPASLLSTLIRTGHPDENGQPRVQMPLSERKIINMWIDLNVPYYPTSTSNYPAELGCRRTYPKELDAVLEEVVTRRCVTCHEEKPPREFYTRVLNPEKNGFLFAPLAESEGGAGRCVFPDGKAVFSSKEDVDYQKILETFIPVQKMIEESPRGDMPGFIPPNDRPLQ